MKTSHRLCLITIAIGLALALSGTTSATPQTRDDNSNQNSAVKSKRKKNVKRRARKRATAVNRDGWVDNTPKVPLPVQGSRVPSSIYADPALFPPRENGIGSGQGTGAGIGPGANSGMGSREISGGGKGVGAGGVVDYSRTFTPRDVDQKARILSKPEALRTEAAKRNKTVGTVVLHATLAASGEVTNIRAVRGLPDGLTESAIEAARRIKFQPAMLDGRVVSQYIRLEYNFNDY